MAVNVPLDKLHAGLKGYPPSVLAAGEEFVATGQAAPFERLVLGMLEHHLPRKPERSLLDMPGSTRLVADLGIDSFTLIEVVFAFEDLFGIALPQEKISTVVTLDDLKSLLSLYLPGDSAAG